MFGYKLVKERNIGKAILAMSDCNDAIMKMNDIIANVDLPESVKCDLWINGIKAFACITDGLHNLDDGIPDLSTALRTMKDEA